MVLQNVDTAGYRYSRSNPPPFILAHVHLREVWPRPKHIECITIRARVANKRYVLKRCYYYTMYMEDATFVKKLTLFLCEESLESKTRLLCKVLCRSTFSANKLQIKF